MTFSAVCIRRFLPFFLCVLPGLLAAANPPDIRQFSFSSQTSKLLPAMTSTELVPGKFGCNGTMSVVDQLGRLALVVLNSTDQGCFTDGAFNSINYPTNKGLVADTGNTVQFEAYRIAPGTTATSFVASGTGVYYQFPTQEDYTVYKLDGTHIKVPALGDLNIYRFGTNAMVYDTRTGFNNGPSQSINRYAQKRQYFNVRKTTGEHGVLWQDQVTPALFIT